MMKSSDFKLFCEEMYRQNCDERRNYKDVILSFEDYFKFNYLFLKEKYATEKVLEEWTQ